MQSKETQFKAALGLLDGTMIVAGSMIGSGIFIVSADISRHVGSAGWLLTVWLITGFMTMVAAISYGELSAMFPKAGGQYVYLREAYNPLVGFVYGWSFFSVIQTGTIAAVAVAFSKFGGYFFQPLELSEANVLFRVGPFTVYIAQIVSILLIIFLTYINTRGIQGGKFIQTTFTATKIIALFGLILFGFLLGSKSTIRISNWTNAWHMFSWNGGQRTSEVVGFGVLGAIAASMVGSIFSSDAWNSVTFIAGEMRNPKRNVGLSLFLGTLLVTVIYLLTNLMYTFVMPMHDIAFAPQQRVAVSAANATFGSAGTYIIAILIMVSTFGCDNGLILSGARVYYTMSRDGVFFRKAGTLNERAVPQWSLWAQCLVACVLCLSGKYGDLLDMVAFVAVAFYALTIAGIFVLRRKRPEMDRPYRAFGYPVLPGIYIILALLFCFALIIQKPTFAAWGMGIALMGIPLYFVAARSK